MAYLSYDRALPVPAVRRQNRVAWSKLLVLAANVGLWVAIIAGARAIL